MLRKCIWFDFADGVGSRHGYPISALLPLCSQVTIMVLMEGFCTMRTYEIFMHSSARAGMYAPSGALPCRFQVALSVSGLFGTGVTPPVFLIHGTRKICKGHRMCSSNRVYPGYPLPEYPPGNPPQAPAGTPVAKNGLGMSSSAK